MNSKEEAPDWREDYFKNPKLHRALARLEKLGADTEYILWLAELVQRADVRHERRPLKRVTVHLPASVALSGAAFLAGTEDRYEFGLRVGELRARFERGQWYGAGDDQWHPSTHDESSRLQYAEMHRLIVNAYMSTAIELAKSGKVKPFPHNPYEGVEHSPAAFAPLTANMLFRLQDAADSTKKRRRVYNQGKSLDSWGTFFLLALSEHLKERSPKKQPYYERCDETLCAVRGRGGKSAKVRVHQFKKAHVEWPQLLAQAAHDFNPPDETKPPEHAPAESTVESAVNLLEALVTEGIIPAELFSEYAFTPEGKSPTPLDGDDNRFNRLLERLQNVLKQASSAKQFTTLH